MPEHKPTSCKPILVFVLWMSIILGVAFPPLWLIPIGIGIGAWARRRNRQVTATRRKRQQVEDDAAYGRRMRGY